MEYNLEKKEIRNDKILNVLDMFTLDFLKVLKRFSDYVVVSGYVSILLGRSRASEDIDMLIPVMDKSQLEVLLRGMEKEGYECANTSIAEEALEILENESGIRFYKKSPLPNVEIKFILKDIQKIAFDERIRVVLRGGEIFISPLELQIAYKLSLMHYDDFEDISSDKDFEDAKHLYEVFKEQLDMKKLLYFVGLFRVEKLWEQLTK